MNFLEAHNKTGLTVVLLLFWASGALAEALSFGVRGYLVKQEVFSLFADPGEEVRLELASYDTRKLRLQLDGRAVGKVGPDSWTLTVPARPGLYKLELEQIETGDRSLLNLFVGTSLEEGKEEIGGYRIGPLPPGHSLYPDLYQQPHLYFEVTSDNVDTRLSEHFTLRQFLGKQESDYPKYVIIKESLLVLLEGLVQAVQQAGYQVETLGVISGYRTPYYNKRIGNVPNSRHVYGDALDFFVDANGDGTMDDLNGDGENNGADVDLLYQIVENYKQQPTNVQLVGGLGAYYKTSHHGGFVHVDTRGYPARW